jgi:nucleotide-binding universal stress UspA family protein
MIALASLVSPRAETYRNERAPNVVPADLLAGVRVSLGSPWEALCKAPREENVDLIVIGSHGYSGLDHVLETTAAKIVNHADRPVLVFRPLPVA